ncbi:antiviral reverse transcriptase Drt3a [Aquirufa salirivi]|uniref:Antiviral reverse transcriptase Drt3a n=1 Tax=Aquirufa salirivi TaxID=3104729 RepID=A0ABW8RVK0_9BACT
MLDQSFSIENFRKILDIENRKGYYLEGDFFSDIKEISKKIKEVNAEIRILKQKGLDNKSFIEERNTINEKKDKLNEQREQKLTMKLTTISSNVTAQEFKIKIVKDISITDKPVYKTEYNLENILTLKQLQYNFRKLYKVKQSSRYAIISQLKNLLDDGFPKIILKTDIKEFYESIPHDNLLNKINDDNLLTHLSMRFIQQILNTFKHESGTTNGVPRGIGISPYLTELYMRDIDAKIKLLPNLMYYARYVDDIILIFMPQIINTNRYYQIEVKEVLSKEELIMNESIGKTKLIDLSNKNINQQYEFEYLGYKFISGYKSNKHIPLKLTISSRKKQQYEDRLKKAFELYAKQSKQNEKKARKLFVKRIKFLTSNTRLVNNKRNVITGIYYTNSLISTTDDLKDLDLCFDEFITSFALQETLASRIRNSNSFVSGFDPTNISKFSTVELNKIMNHWTK